AMAAVPRELRELVLRSSRDHTGICVAVTDTGIGVDPRTSACIFDPFFTTKPGGTGMGLAICKSIIEAHGGRIWASPNTDRGTTCQFTLPAEEGASTTPPPSLPEAERGEPFCSPSPLRGGGGGEGLLK